MNELTAKDVSAIQRIVAIRNGPMTRDELEDVFRAGIVAGIERAAKHMESESTNTAIKIRALLK